MKNWSEVIIFLGYVLWVEFVGGIVYRNLINDTPRKDGLESHYFNEEKTMNDTEVFERQGSRNDYIGSENGMIGKGGEEQAYLKQVQDGFGQEGSGEKTDEQYGLGKLEGQDSQCGDVTKNGSIVQDDKKQCSCGEQGGNVEKDEDGNTNSRQDTQTENDGTEVNRVKSNIKDAAVDGKDAEKKKNEDEHFDSEVDAADGKEDDAKTSNGNVSDENRGIIEETSTEGTKVDEMDKNAGSGIVAIVQTFTFSPLNR